MEPREQCFSLPSIEKRGGTPNLEEGRSSAEQLTKKTRMRYREGSVGIFSGRIDLSEAEGEGGSVLHRTRREKKRELAGVPRTSQEEEGSTFLALA